MKFINSFLDELFYLQTLDQETFIVRENPIMTLNIIENLIYCIIYNKIEYFMFFLSNYKYFLIQYIYIYNKNEIANIITRCQNSNDEQ